MKKIKSGRPSPAMVVALAALFLALGGTAYGLDHGRVGARELGSIKLRSGKFFDRDVTAHDGVFAAASGHAVCKPGEQLISGGYRQRAGSEPFVIGHVSALEDGPVPSKREWTVKLNSDLGGAAREDFTVFADCLVK
jgi:hypothetical protein